MKISQILAVALFTAFASAHAGINILDSNYRLASSPYVTHVDEDWSSDIVSFDWDSGGNLYYSTYDTEYWLFTGLHKVSNGVKSTVVGTDDLLAMSGASVAAAGNNIYFNTDTARTHLYNESSGLLSPISTEASYNILAHDNALYVTAGIAPDPLKPSVTHNHIFYNRINPDGTLAAGIDLGDTGLPNSGPLAFDAAGNLYYAPGYGDKSIYKWLAVELEAAINLGAQLSITDHVWLNYGSAYDVSGATSMLFDSNGDLLVTLTDFSHPSYLAKFGVDDATGNYDGNVFNIFETDERPGELRSRDGKLYLADGNQIFEIESVPEPSTVLLTGLGLLLAAGNMRRLRKAEAV